MAGADAKLELTHGTRKKCRNQKLSKQIVPMATGDGFAVDLN
jgi:hypothetical protein